MLKISAITDGISHDLDRALAVMRRAGLSHCEIQDLWGKGVGDLTDAEVAEAARLLQHHDVQSVCLSRKLFVGLPAGKIGPTDSAFVTEMDRLRRCIDIAHTLGAPVIRSMSMQREAILHSRNGPSIWNNGATWDRFIELFKMPVRVAEAAGITLVVETSFTGMVNTAYMGSQLVETIGSPNLKILWDPANCLYFGEKPLPDGYSALKTGALGHVHLKDVHSIPARSTNDCCPLGQGDMGPYLQPLVDYLLDDGFQGAVCLENVYCPDGGSVEDGFQASIGTFRSLFGDCWDLTRRANT